MKFFAFVLGVLNSLVCTAALADPARESTFFRSFAERPDSETIWAEETGQLESRDAKALISAVVIENKRQNEEQQICGVKVDLTDGNRSESLYIEEKYVRPILHAVRSLEAAIDANNGQEARTYGCRGVVEYCCNPQPPYDLFSVDYCYDSPAGLAITVPGETRYRFDFPGYRPMELALSLQRAVTVLESRDSAKVAME